MSARFPILLSVAVAVFVGLALHGLLAEDSGQGKSKAKAEAIAKADGAQQTHLENLTSTSQPELS